MGVGELTRGRDRLRAAQRDGDQPFEVCGVVVRAVHDVCRFDACAVMLTDTDTTLPSGGVVEGFDPSMCAPFWDNELLDPDFNKFRDLLRCVDPVATLVDAVDGDLERSPRYQKFYRSNGVTDELRAVFASGPSCLAVAVFTRCEGCFTPEELHDVRELVPVVTATFRSSFGRMAVTADGAGPAVIILDGDDEITSITAGGARLLDDLRGHELDRARVPGLIRTAAMRARWSRAATTVTTRMVGRSGQWLRVHVAPLQGDARSVAITIECARPDDIVSIVMESYGFTPRETDIVVRLARGMAAKEVGLDLAISVHTVRDHIKAIYDKAGVNSRGELMAQLFTNHYLERFHDSVVHLG
jgi:DNA-binding CsgD family transcriptional regulator